MEESLRLEHYITRRQMMKITVLTGSAVLLASPENEAKAATRPPTGGNFDPPSPLARPFLQELPRMPVKCSLPNGADDLLLPENGGVQPNGTVHPQITGNDVFTTYDGTNERIVATQQRNTGARPQFAPKRHYVLKARESTHVFHPDPPYNCGSIIWGYDGLYPGPTFVSRYGVPILVRIFNRLYFDEQGNPIQRPIPGGFGNRQISTHLHNGHTASESDGNPEDIYPLRQLDQSSPNKYPDSIVGIDFRDHHYAMFRAGLDPSRPAALPAPNINDGDPRETVSTLWYHDHSMDFTAENVYKGLVGFHILYDELDSGDENDPDPNALRLPSHEFDIPILIQDKRFDANGQLFLTPREATSGFIGDRFVVNGAIQPKLSVLRRKYRFRLLNAGPSRFYKFFLVKNGEDRPFQIIGNDESLLEHPLTSTDGSNTSSVLVSVAERADVVIDFSQFATGDQVYLVNRLVMKDDGQGPVANFDAATGKFKFKVLDVKEGGDQILRFDVAGDAPDPSHVKDTLRLNPNLPTYLTDILQKADLKRVRDDLKKLPNHFEFRFAKSPEGGDRGWTINEKNFKKFRKDWCALQGGAPGASDGEVWTLKNEDRSWSHPIHIHMEEFRILLRSTVDPEPASPPAEPTSTERPLPFEQGKKDVLILGPNEEVQIFLRFRDFLGKYPIHCHNVVHEDHAMMARFDVVLERTADCPPVPPTP